MKILAFAVTVALWAATINAEARCNPQPPTLEERVSNEDEVVAYGTVTQIHTDYRAAHNGYAVLSLEAIWRGYPPNSITIYPVDSVHGYPYEKGKSYLIFTSKYNGRFVDSICGLTCSGDQCLPALKLLGEPARHFKK